MNTKNILFKNKIFVVIVLFISIGGILTFLNQDSKILLSQFSGINTTPLIAGKEWKPSTSNVYRGSMPSEYVTRIDALIISIMNRGSKLSKVNYIGYITSVSDGIALLGKKSDYANDKDVLNTIGYIAYELKNIKDNLSSENLLINDVASVIDNSLQKYQNGTEAPTILTDTKTVVSRESNSITHTDTNQNKNCFKEISFGDLNICDTGKQAVYKEINSLCPTGFHVPNYWEMQDILGSGIKLNLSGNMYYIASLYSDTHKDTSYPYYNNPYIYQGGTSMNHTSDTQSVIETRKEGVICINNGVVRSVNNNDLSAFCSLQNDKSVYSAGVSGNYTSQTVTRAYLFRGEELSLASSTSIELYKGNMDFILNLSCGANGKLTKTEKIAKVNNCKYGYSLKENDCIADVTVCNIENLGNVHSTNSKVCSWKELGTQTASIPMLHGLMSLNKDSVAYNENIVSEVNAWTKKIENEIKKNYNEKYNSKVDIKVDCSLGEEASSSSDQRNKKLVYPCVISGLFWQ